VIRSLLSDKGTNKQREMQIKWADFRFRIATIVLTIYKKRFTVRFFSWCVTGCESSIPITNCPLLRSYLLGLSFAGGIFSACAYSFLSNSKQTKQCVESVEQCVESVAQCAVSVAQCAVSVAQCAARTDQGAVATAQASDSVAQASGDVESASTGLSLYKMFGQRSVIRHRSSIQRTTPHLHSL